MRAQAASSQFLWKFSGVPLTEPEQSREINRRIHAVVQGDPLVVNPSSLMRLPGTIAWPRKPGRVKELTDCIVPDNGGPPVSIDALRAELPDLDAEPIHQATAGASTTADVMDPIGALMDHIRGAELTGAEWRFAMLSLTAKLYARGTPISAIMGLANFLTRPGYTVEETRKRMAEMLDGARRRGFGDDGPTSDPDGDADLIADVLNVPPKKLPSLGIWNAGQDDSDIPPRGWLLGSTFCRRFLSSLIAEGGVGKTAVRMVQLLSLATARPLSGEHIFRRCRVLILSFEDDKDELRRRVAAVALHHAITPPEMDGWLFLAAPKGLKLIVRGERGEAQLGALRGLLIEAIEQYKIDVVSLDPFIKTHGMEENDNNAIDLVCETLAEIAIEYDCSLDLPHHTPGKAR